MKLCPGILNHALNQANDEHFHFYNSLVLTDVIAFQRVHFRKVPKNTPHMYTPDAATNDDELPLQTRTNDQNNTLLKKSILIISNASTQEITQSIIDSGASHCVTPRIKDFLKRPRPKQNTTLKGIAGALAALGRGIIQLKVKQKNKEPIILVIDNVIYAPECTV
jgi:hypothetical protein